MDSFLLVIQWQELAGILPNVVSAVKSNQKMVVFVSRLKKSFQGISYIFAFWLHSSQTRGRDHIPLVQGRLMHRIVEAQTNSDSCQRPTVSSRVSKFQTHLWWKDHCEFGVQLWHWVCHLITLLFCLSDVSYQALRTQWRFRVVVQLRHWQKWLDILRGNDLWPANLVAL